MTVPVIAFLVESPARRSLNHHDEIDGESDYSCDPLAAENQSEAKEQHDKREGGWPTWLVLAVEVDIRGTKNIVLFRSVCNPNFFSQGVSIRCHNCSFVEGTKKQTLCPSWTFSARIKVLRIQFRERFLLP